MNDFLNAIYQNDIDSVKQFLINKSPMPYTEDKDSGFIVACNLGYKEIVELFLHNTYIFNFSLIENEAPIYPEKFTSEITYGLMHSVMARKMNVTEYLFNENISKDILNKIQSTERETIIFLSISSLANIKLLDKYNFMNFNLSLSNYVNILKKSESGEVFKFLLESFSLPVHKEFFKDLLKSEDINRTKKKLLNTLEYFIKDQPRDYVLEIKEVFTNYSIFRLFNCPDSQKNAIFFLNICNEALLFEDIENKITVKNIENKVKPKKKI